MASRNRFFISVSETSKPILRSARRAALSTLLAASAISLTMTAGCTEYWWQRGQPPAVATLLTRSKQKLDDSLTQYRAARPQVATVAAELEKNMNQALALADKNAASAEVLPHLKQVRGHMMSLEGKLSWGSRPAHGELNGELRSFVDQAERGEQVSKSALGLYSARVYTFLANELSVPEPVIYTVQPGAAAQKPQS
jgi:hypothetical protein